MASVNLVKSFIAAVLVALLVIVGYICQSKNSEATRIAEKLNAYEAQVQRVQHYGKGNYYSFVVLNVNGENFPSTLDSKVGEVGSIVTIWSSPNFSLSYAHKSQPQERAKRSWMVFLIFLPIVLMILFAMFSRPVLKPFAAYSNSEKNRP